MQNDEQLLIDRYPLGRRESPDERDKNYPFSLVLGADWPKTQRRKWTPGPILDQGLPDACRGKVNSCVGQSFRQLLASTPVPVSRHSGPSACDIYEWAIKNDEWPWNDNRDDGTSLRAGVQYLVNQGRVKTYLWSWDYEEVARWILTRGPVILGTAWHTSMFTPDANGYVIPNGRKAGGHAYEVYGVDRSLETFYGVNSWGTSWGLGGHFKIHYSTMNHLLVDGGEACTATEQRIK